MVYGMENYIKILAVAIVLVFAGCKDWLDVTPAGQATESDLFSTGDGYRSVLNGLYKSMGKPELYGRNWSYGMLDCMAQLYNLESGSFNDEMCKAAAKYEYTNTQVSSSIESAWGIAYNIIANANDLLQNIVDNPEYKKLAISILKKFDESIVDICYTKADDESFVESIITENGVNMPFSVYGDGIKKILYILNKLFDATDSILLIDEIETGLHKKYYDKLFPVVFELAKKLNVQLFIATHSMEAIDAILEYGKYENDTNSKDPIKVITLKKIDSNDGKGSNIAARNVTGKYVYENRKAFEFEVRL